MYRLKNYPGIEILDISVKPKEETDVLSLQEVTTDHLPDGGDVLMLSFTDYKTRTKVIMSRLAILTIYYY